MGKTKTVPTFFRLKIISSIVKSIKIIYIISMQNPIKTTYNFIKNLKQFHAIHVCIWPTFFYFLFLCWIFYTPSKNHCDEVPAYYFGLCLLAIFTFFITFFSTISAIVLEAVILIIQFLIHKKIVIRWNFIIDNIFFNFIFFIALIVYIIALIMLIYLAFH